MPSANEPPPVPGVVPMPMIDETANKQKILIAVVAGLAIILLTLLLLLLFGKKGASANTTGNGLGTSGIKTGTGNSAWTGMIRGNTNGSEKKGTGISEGWKDTGEKATAGNQKDADTAGDEAAAGKNGWPEPPDDDLSGTNSVSEDTSLDESQVENSTEFSPPASESEGDDADEEDDEGNEDDDGGDGEGGGGGGGGGRGGEAALPGDRLATVRVFGVNGNGTKFVYVFDRSGSMTGHKLEGVKKELLRSLSTLNFRHQFNIIFYDDRYIVWEPKRKLVIANARAKKEAEEFVRSIGPRGGTSHLPPLLAAIQCQPEVIFFLTDGQDLTEEQLAKINQQSGNISINVIQYDDGRDGQSQILRRLAELNRGDYQYIDVSKNGVP